MTIIRLANKIVFTLILCIGIGAFVLSASAEPNPSINYQGKLTTNTGVAVDDSTYNMRFFLYDDPSAATTSAIWTEELTSTDKVTVTNGLFSVMLGSTTDITSVNFNQTLYLGIEIGGSTTLAWDGEMSPRKVLGTVPAAFVAYDALDSAALGGIASTSFLRSDQADSATGLLTFTGGLLSTASSTITDLTFGTATGTTLIINGESITDFTGAGLQLTNNALTVATSSLNLAISDTTGTLAVSRGGTGSTTPSGFLFGNGAGSLASVYSISGSYVEDVFLRNDGNDTTTGLLTMNGGLLSLASSTIGDGTAAGGLTVSGNSTTTGNLIVQGSGTSTFAGSLNVGSGGLVYDVTSGRVGVGTQAPSDTFEVVGDIVSKGTSWTARTAAGDNDAWFAVTYGNGLFVAVSYSGDRVMTSPDGITWTARTAAGDDDGWFGVTYGNGLFVAVSFSGDRVMTSPDGITWTARTAAGDDDSWRSVTYGNGLFVAVGETGDRVMTSPDGITWTARTAAGDNDAWFAVTYGNGLFVAVSYSGDRVMTSPDGITWTARTAAGDDDGWFGVTYGNGLFVAVSFSGDRVMTSPDGITWTARTAAGDNDTWLAVTYGNGLFVAVGETGDRVMTSPDGITWTARTAAGDDDAWLAVTYGNGLFVAVGETGDRVMTSGRTETSALAHNNTYQGGMQIFGNVGIGTSSPYALLSITGSTTADLLSFTQQGSGDLLALSNSTDEVFTILNNGYVGIGTTSPLTLLTVGSSTASYLPAANLYNSTLVSGALEVGGLSYLGGGLLSYASSTFLSGLSVVGNATTTGNLIVQGSGTSTFAGGIETTGNLDINGTATSTFANGITLEGGCLSINDVCITESSDTSIVVAASNSQYKNYADYIADGTNDEEEIQAALDSLPATGGTVYLLEGLYNVGTTTYTDRAINMATGTRLIGEGKSTIIKLQDHDASINIIEAENVQDVYIGHLAVDGNKAVQGAGYYSGINISNTSSSTVEMVMVYDVQDTAIVLDGAIGGEVLNNRFTNNGQYGIGLFDSTYNTITNNTISDNDSRGIYLWSTSTHNTVINNKITNNSSHGIYADDPAGHNRFSNNIVINNTSSGFLIESGHNIINDNRVSGNGNDGIYIGHTNFPSSNNVIADNLVTNNATDGIQLTLSSDNTITGNNIQGNGVGVHLYYFSDANAITGNLIKENATYGIHLNLAAANNTLVGNSIADNGGGGANNYSIFIDGTSDWTDNNLISSNNIQATGTASLIWIDSSNINATNIVGNSYSNPDTNVYITDNGVGTKYNEWDRTTITTDSERSYNLFSINGSSSLAAAALTQQGTGDIFALSNSTDEVFTILNNGYVGIGTTSPLTLLTVGSSTASYLPAANLYNSTLVSGALEVGGLSYLGGGLLSYASSTFLSGLSVVGNATTTGNLIVQGSGTSTFAGSLNVGSGGLVYDVTSGRVGVGTQAPSDTFEVVGDIVSKGTSWTARTAAGDNDAWLAVTYGNGLFVAVGETGDRVMTSPDGITWTARTAAGDDDAWLAVTYGNGLFVAVGETGDRVMTSPDGITWTARTAAGDDDGWFGVTYGNGLFVAVSFSGDRVMTSPDGITWTARTAAGDDDSWRSVTYGNGLFVAVGETGDRVMTSPDGITWTARTAAGDDDSWYAITYGNGLFVAVSYSGDRVMTSPDGITWTARTAAGDDDGWFGVTYGNGLFVAVSFSGDRVMTSPDGITWTARTAAGDNDTWLAVTYGNGLFVAVSYSGDRVMTSGRTETSALAHNNTYQGGMQIFGNVGIGTSSPYALLSITGSTTADLLSFTQQGSGDLLALSNSTDEVFTILNNGYVGIGTTSPLTLLTVGSSTASYLPAANLYNSTLVSGALEVGGLSYLGGGLLSYASSTFLSGLSVVGNATTTGNLIVQGSGTSTFAGSLNVGSGGLVYDVTSGRVGVGTQAPSDTFEVVGDIVSKGTSWTARTAAGDNDAWLAVTYGNGLFVAVGQTGDRVMTSPDGITWTARTAAGDDDAWLAVTYGNGLFVAVGETGDRVMTSPDGITWTARTAAGDDDSWRSVTYGNGLFVAVGVTGDRVITSSDGITWTARTAAGDDDSWRSVTYGNGLFVAVGVTGDRVMTSPDGITWTARTAAGDDDSWRSVTYGNGLFVAVSYSGDRVITSPDGITWTARTAAGDDDGWLAVTYGNGLFVAVSFSGDRVMTSPDGITWTARTAAGDDDSWYAITYGNGLFVAVSYSGDRVMTSGRTETSALAHNNTYQGGMQIFGNVGIGTSSPYALLSITGSTTADLLSFTQQGSGDLLALSNSTDEVFTILNNGYVGIGTTSPLTLLTVGSSTPTHLTAGNYYNSAYIAGALEVGGLSYLGGGLLSYASSTFLSGLSVVGNATTTGNLIVQGSGTSTFAGGIETTGNLDINGTATSTFANGITLEGGCLSINDVCITESSDTSIVVAASNSQYKNYADYIADGTNDEEEIQAALDSLPATGGTVYLLEGLYNVGTTTYTDRAINMATGTRLIGEGKSTIIKLQDHDASINIIEAENVQDVYIGHLAVDGNKAVQGAGTYNGISFTGAPSSTIDGVEVYNVQDDGISLNSGDEIVVENSVIYDQGNYGVAFNTVSDSVLRENYVYNNAAEGVLLNVGSRNSVLGNRLINNDYGLYLYDANYNNITDNTIKDNTNSGIHVNGDLSDSDHNTVSDNVIVNNDNGIYLYRAHDNVVVGNYTSGNSTDGVYLNGSDRNNISVNVMENNGDQGIEIDWGSTENNVAVNTISNNTTEGIELDFNVNNNTIIGNYIYNNGGSNNYDGIKLISSSDSNLITNNHITDTAGGGSAIYISSDSENNVLANNYYSGTGAAYINDQNGTTEYVAHNRLSLNANDTDYGGAHTAISITQSGTGDIVNFFDDTTEVFTILDGGYVGIGTTSPLTLLTVGSSTASYLPAANLYNSALVSGALEVGGLSYLGGGLLSYASSTFLSGLSVVGNATTTGNLIVQGSGTSTFTGGIETNGTLDINGTATSTFANGITLEGGCLSVNGACLTQGAFASFGGYTYLNTLTDFVGIGTTTGDAKLYIEGNADQTSNLLSVSSSTVNAVGTAQGLYTQIDNLGKTTLTGRVLNPVKVGGYNVANNANSVMVSGDYAYLGTSNSTAELQIIDVSSPTSPVLASSVNLAASLNQVITVGHYAYLGLSTNGGDDFEIYDVVNPNSPVKVGGVEIAGGVSDVVIRGHLAFLGTNNSSAELQIFNITDPTNPVKINEVNLSGVVNTLALVDNYLYLGASISAEEFQIFDATDPTSLVKMGTIDFAGNMLKMIVSGSYVYALISSGNELQVIDVSDMNNPSAVGSIDVPNAIGIDVAGSYAYLATIGAGDNFRIIDISDPTNPQNAASVEPATLALDVDIVGSYAYLATLSNGGDEFEIYDIGSLEVANILAGNIHTDQLMVDQTALFDQGVSIRGGANIGQNTLIGGALTITGTASSTLLANNTNPALIVSSGYIGFGTTTPTAKLALDSRSFSGAGVVGFDQYLETENIVDSALQSGNYLFLNASNTATTTTVGQFVRIADDTQLGNTVRGIEVQTNRGINTEGENTALSGTARTFGVRGITTADAGGVYEPAGGYFETRGAASGNAIRGFSSSITTASLLALFHSSSSFDGTGLEMNFGNGIGDFSSSSSKYLDFQNTNTSVFTVSAFGTTTIGDGTTQAGLQIMNGGLCVDNGSGGGCSASTTGRITAVEYNTGNSDLAEMYFSDTELVPGEVVSLAGGLSINRANQLAALPILGVVSTKPGLLLGYDDSSLNERETGYPVALSGRVPVKLSTEAGEIKAGDYLMLSSLPGIAMKATGTGQVIGIALEDFDNSRMYSDTYINQFGDDMVEPSNEPILTNFDPRINDGCYYGGGSDIGDEPCVPLTSTTTIGLIEEANELAEQDSIEEQLEELAKEDSNMVTLEDGSEVQVGHVVMFVDRSERWLDAQSTAVLSALVGTDGLSSTGSNETETLFDRLVTLANSFIDGVLSIMELKANRVEVSEELCVNGVCVTADDLRALIDLQNDAGNSDVTETVDPDNNKEPIVTVDDPKEPVDDSGDESSDGSLVDSETDDSSTKSEGDSTTEEAGVQEEGGVTIDGVSETELENGNETEETVKTGLAVEEETSTDMAEGQPETETEEKDGLEAADQAAQATQADDVSETVPEEDSVVPELDMSVQSDLDIQSSEPDVEIESELETISGSEVIRLAE